MSASAGASATSGLGLPIAEMYLTSSWAAKLTGGAESAGRTILAACSTSTGRAWEGGLASPYWSTRDKKQDCLNGEPSGTSEPVHGNRGFWRHLATVT